MSTREKAQFILNSLTDEQHAAFVTLFGGNFPNDETQQAMDEIENGGGTLFTGTTEQLFSSLMED
ncbi:MAG: hypothetical protein ACI4JS_03275 [Oscillospiraceae bacterium]